MENWFFQFFPSSDVTRALKIFQLKSSIFECPRDVTWWENQFSMQHLRLPKTGNSNLVILLTLVITKVQKLQNLAADLGPVLALFFSLHSVLHFRSTISRLLRYAAFSFTGRRTTTCLKIVQARVGMSDLTNRFSRPTASFWSRFRDRPWIRRACRCWRTSTKFCKSTKHGERSETGNCFRLKTEK